MIDANETILDQIDYLMPSGAMVDTSALCMPWGVSRERHMCHVSHYRSPGLLTGPQDNEADN